MKIGIIGAMHEEIVELKTSMTDINEIEISNLKFYEGKLCSKDVILVESGIGKVNAAISTTLLISNFKVESMNSNIPFRALEPYPWFLKLSSIENPLISA